MKFKILFFLLLGKTMVFSQEFSGKVINDGNKQAVPYASVYFIDLEIGAKTDESGSFTIKGTFPDSARIRVRAFGFEDLYAKKSKSTMVFELSETHLKLPEASVSSPISNIQKDNIVFIDARRMDEISSIPGGLGDVLTNIPGVYQSSTGVGISKPVIRGMQGSRVVTLLNGLRIENQQWGGDHGNVFTSLGIGSVEIIKGPASLMFGADAIGGTAYFVDRPYVPQNSQKIRLETRYESVTQGIISSGIYQVSKKNWRLSAAGLFSDQADYQLPSRQYALNSRFSERGGKLAFGYNRKKWLMNIRYAFAQNYVGLPGHTHDSVINPAEFQVDNQSRKYLIPLQVSNNHFLSVENKWLKKNGNISLLVGHTFNQLKEYEEKVTVAALNTALNNSLYHLRWTYNKAVNKSTFRLVSGVQGGIQLNRNGISWSDELIPDFNQLDNGVYALGAMKKGSWSTMLGARYDHRNLDVSNSELAGSFQRNYQSVNGSAGAVYNKLGNTARLNVSTGFRSPHVSELSAYGQHHGALRYEIGSINLVSERGTQVDFSYELSKEHIEIIVNPFFNYISNYITVTPQDSIIDGLQVFQYEQLPTAQLYGGDIGMHYHPHFAHWLHVEMAYSHIVSDNGRGGYLPLIPQNRLSTSIRVQLEDLKWKKLQLKELSVQHKFFDTQNQVADVETVSPSYNLLNMGVTMSIAWKAPLEIGVGIKNALNESYIDHLSRLKNISLQHPGRSVYIRLAWDLTLKTNKNEIK